MEVFSVTSLASGLISIGKNDNEVPSSILNKIIEYSNTDFLKSPHMRLSALGLSLCYFGARDNIEVPSEAISIIEDPFKTAMKSILLMCAYAGTGDVLTIQELLHIVGEKVDIPPSELKKDKKTERKEKKARKNSVTNIKGPKQPEWDYSMGQAMATLAVAVVAIGEDIGKNFMSYKKLNFVLLRLFILVQRFSIIININVNTHCVYSGQIS